MSATEGGSRSVPLAAELDELRLRRIEERCA
jgi:hypothetical protein